MTISPVPNDNNESSIVCLLFLSYKKIHETTYCEILCHSTYYSRKYANFPCIHWTPLVPRIQIKSIVELLLFTRSRKSFHRWVVISLLHEIHLHESKLIWKEHFRHYIKWPWCCQRNFPPPWDFCHRLVPADKASNNYTFVCKIHYVSILAEDFGLNSLPWNPTYNLTDFSAS